MPKVSKIKIDANLEGEIVSQFWSFLGNINSSKTSTEFFSDFLTDSEKIMLAKRFATTVLLARGKIPVEINKSIHVTYTTIGCVSSWLKNSKPETQRLLQNISKQKDWEAVFDKIDEILDKFPPRRHSDWKEEYKKKRERTRKREAKKSLR